MRDNLHLLELMTEALVEFEVLDADEIMMLIKDGDLVQLRADREAEAALQKEKAEQALEKATKTGFTSKLKEQGSIGDWAPGTPT